MQKTEIDPVTLRWDFPGLFVLYTAILVAVIEMSDGSMLAFREFTTSALAIFWGLFSVPVVCSGTQLTLTGFPMEIVLECTGLHYMILFIAGVLAFRSHNLSYRAAGIVIGTLTIFLLNIARIGVIGFVGRYFGSVFEFVHDYLWQGIFALSVVLIWTLWVNGKNIFSLRLINHILVVFVSALFSFWLVVTFLEAYIAFLAALSNTMFRVLSLFIEVPEQVVNNGKSIGYAIGNKVIYSETTLYVLNAALLLPIASITFIRSQKMIFLKRLCTATILLVISHLLIIALDWLLVVIGGPGYNSVIVWCIVMSAFIAPILIWPVVMNIFRSTPSSDSRSSPQ